MFAVRIGIPVPREYAHGRVPSGRIFRSEPQHMADCINFDDEMHGILLYFVFKKKNRFLPFKSN
jgi:hypothetical protein